MLEIETGKDNPVLRAPSTPVKSFDRKLKSFARELKETVANANGLGLAAPQVGVNKRLFVVKIKERFVLIVNPEITDTSDAKEIGEEGCLSLPNIWGNVERAKEITVKYSNLKGETRVLKLEGLEAREVQHEHDHLEGILFVDKLIHPIINDQQLTF